MRSTSATAPALAPRICVHSAGSLAAPADARRRDTDLEGGVAKGVAERVARVFAADLARAIELPLRIEFMGLSSYGEDTKSSGVVQITQDVSTPLAGEDVLIVEDIVDTGLTLHYLLQQIQTRGPASVRICSLLHKPAREVKKVAIDYLGFTIEDRFVIGYGLDWAQKYRNLPFIGEVTNP